MKSFNRIGDSPVGLPLLADDVVEFHAARLVLLLAMCGTSGRIDGLTKMAKLDFFVRYPDFFESARAASTSKGHTAATVGGKSDEAVESAMVRHHYGPWDKRYYHILAYLESKQLITVTKERNSYRLALTDLGLGRSKELANTASFIPLVERMREVKKTFGRRSGNSLKDLIYSLFETEVNQRQLGEVIKR
ncbi:hypothetical protein ACFL2Q_16350 [Thermodesulfobacteriota bacterium]